MERVSLIALLRGHNRFVIPHYQRKYSWTEDNCKTLFDDVLKVARELINDHAVTHFFSNVTLSPLVLDDKCGFHVVDGQQRLATFSLFLKAYAKVFSTRTNEIRTFLQIGPLLKLSFEDAVDQRTYRHLMLDRFCEPESVSQIMVDNFNLFEKEVRAEVETFGNVLCANLFEQLILVKVVLPEVMPPQRVFERMNGVRAELKQLDLIKNFLLMEAGENDELAVYNLWEGHLLPLGWLDWVCRMISTMHAHMHDQWNVAEKNIYKNFRRFYESYGKTFCSVLEFLNHLETWHNIFIDVVTTFTLLNGNGWLIPERRNRLGPLIMKLAILFSSEEDRSRRNLLIARMVEYQRCFFATKLWHRTKISSASFDEKISFRCLTKSGKDYDKELLCDSIFETFGPNTTDAEAAIAWWFHNCYMNNEPSRNAGIIGILPAEESVWVSADEIVAHFHESLRRNKEALGIPPDLHS